MIGLLLWVAFIFWVIRRRPSGAPAQLLATRLMWIVAIIYWMTALIGTGLLTSIPASMLLMIQMGRAAAEARARPSATPAFRGYPVAPKIAA